MHQRKFNGILSNLNQFPNRKQILGGCFNLLLKILQNIKIKGFIFVDCLKTHSNMIKKHNQNFLSSKSVVEKKMYLAQQARLKDLIRTFTT